MESHQEARASYGQLMSSLLAERARFANEDEFKDFALAEVRSFIVELRTIGIELTMRANYGGQPLSQHSVTAKLTKP